MIFWRGEKPRRWAWTCRTPAARNFVSSIRRALLRSRCRPRASRLLGIAFAVALAAGLLASFVASELMPTFHDARSLRVVTERPLLGMVSMLPNESVRRKQLRNVFMFAGGLSGLIASFTAVLAFALLMGRGRVRSRTMSLIEQAAKRLEELRRAGAELAGGRALRRPFRRVTPRRAGAPCPISEALVRELNARDAESPPVGPLRTRTGGEPATPRDSGVRARLKPQVRVEIGPGAPQRARFCHA